MRKAKMIVLTLILTMVATTAGAFACTGAYIGKDVSAEGTTVIARSEDQGSGSYNKMFKVQPRVNKAGRYMVDEGDDQNGFKVPLPKLTYKYTYVPDSSDAGDGQYPASCTNEYGLAVVGTVSASPCEDYEKEDPYKETGTGLREAILPALIACQCKTAKEAVNKLAELVDEYGSEEGNILFFTDKDEAWIFEIYGGHGYAAMKMPTDKVAVFGNQFMIDVVDQNDSENYVFSKDLFATIDKIGAVKEDGKYNLVKSISRTRSEYSNMRTWIGHKILAPSTAGEYSDDVFYPLFYTPDSKVSVLDVMDIYRNRYEGTAYDMTLAENESRRPIGVTRTSDTHIIQTYTNLPADTCQLQWLSMGNAQGSVFVPSFSGITDTYAPYKVDGNDFTTSSAYFRYKRIAAMAAKDREFLMKGVTDFYKLEEEMMQAQINTEITKVASAYKKSKTNGRAYVTSLAKSMAKTELSATTNLYKKLAQVSINNINDRTNNARKTTFVADTKLTKAAKFKGYTVKKSGKTYTLKKDDTTYKLTKGESTYEVTKAGETTTAELTHAPYVSGGYIYAPMDFIQSL